MSASAERLGSPTARGLPVFLVALVGTGLGAAVALDARSAAILTAALLAPMLVWAEPRFTFLLLAVTLGLNIDLLRAPVSVSLPQLAALALIAAMAIRPARAGGAGAAAFAGLVFLAATLPSLPRAVHPAGAYAGVLQLGVLALLLVAAVRGTTERWVQPESLLRWLLAGALLSLVPAFAQVVFDIGPAPFRTGGVMRAWSTYTQPNSYALYLAALFPVALGLALARRSTTRLAVAGALLLGIAFTGSRGAWLGTAAGLIAFFAATTRLRLSAVGGTVIGILLLLALLPLIPDGLIEGRLDLGDWSVQQRVLILLTAWDGILRNPILGYGDGAFGFLLPALARQGLTDDVVIPHNLLLQIWFELGLAALLCFLVLCAMFLVRAFRAARRRHDARLAGVFAGVSALLGTAMFGTLFIRGVQETFVLLVAAGIGLLRTPPEPARETLDAPALPV